MKKNSTLWEMVIGILAVGVLSQVVCLLVWNRLLYNSVGLWVGVGLSVGLAFHMQTSIDEGLDMQGEEGIKHMRKGTLVRYGIACAVMGALLYMGWGNPLTLLVGVMALKAGAYLQPTVHRLLGRKKGKKEVEDRVG